MRDEAERLVAAAIAAVSLGRARARRGRRPPRRWAAGFATGSAECCVCPVCRVISAMRDPSPDLAERLATGAGDLAAGVAGLLRSLSRGPGGRSEPEPRSEGDEFWDGLRRRAAGGRRGSAGRRRRDADPWRSATRAPRRRGRGGAAARADGQEGREEGPEPAPADAAVGCARSPPRRRPRRWRKKAVAKKAAKKATPPPAGAAP